MVKPKIAENIRRMNVKKAVGRPMMQNRTKLRGRPTAAEKMRKSLVGWKTAAELMAILCCSVPSCVSEV